MQRRKRGGGGGGLLPKGTCPAINQKTLRTVTKNLATILLLHLHEQEMRWKRSTSKREKVSIPCKAALSTCAEKVLCPFGSRCAAHLVPNPRIRERRFWSVRLKP